MFRWGPASSASSAPWPSPKTRYMCLCKSAVCVFKKGQHQRSNRHNEKHTACSRSAPDLATFLAGKIISSKSGLLLRTLKQFLAAVISYTMRRLSKWLPKHEQITLSKPGMWSLSSRLTAFKLSFLKWWWMISLSHWWRGRSKAVSLSEQTWSSSSSSTTPRCSIAKKTIEPVLWNKSHWLISLFVFQYYFFAKSDLDFSIDFFSYLFCIFQIILLPNIMFYPIITTLDGGGGSGQE